MLSPQEFHDIVRDGSDTLSYISIGPVHRIDRVLYSFDVEPSRIGNSWVASGTINFGYEGEFELEVTARTYHRVVEDAFEAFDCFKPPNEDVGFIESSIE